MATKDTGGQQQARKSDQEQEAPEAQAGTDVAERHEKLSDDVPAFAHRPDEEVAAAVAGDEVL